MYNTHSDFEMHLERQKAEYIEVVMQNWDKRLMFWIDLKKKVMQSSPWKI